MHFIERAVDEHRPIVLSLRYGPASSHIVPVLGYDEKWVYFLFLNLAHADGTKDVRAIRRWELARATRSGVSARRRGSRRSVEPLALATGRVVLPDARTSWRTASCSRSSTPFTDADGGARGLVLKVLR